MTADEKAVWNFLREPIWAVGTPQFEAWMVRCRGLGSVAPQVFLEALASGTEQQQFSALYALRQHGYEAWEDGYGSATTYRVRPPSGDWRVIKPLHPPADR